MGTEAKTVLVVDDEGAVVKTIATMLTSHGFSVLTAFSGREALNVLKKQPVPLVITDVRMPFMDGRELLTRIKADFRQTKVVAISGNEYDALEFKLRGAIGFVRKPIDFTKLVKLARHAFDMEKRASIRHPARIPVLINGRIAGQAYNLSADGILVATDQPLEEGPTAKITIRFPEHRQALEAEGYLVRTIPAGSMYLIAFYFINHIGSKLPEYIQYFSPGSTV